MLTNEERNKILRHAMKYAEASFTSYSFTSHPTAECVEFVAYVESLLTQARAEERKRCAAYCGLLAEMMEQGAGELTPGGRLRQAEQTILADNHNIRARKDDHG